MRARHAWRVALVAGLLVAAGDAAAQYQSDARLAEAHGLAASAYSALQACLAGKGAGATCRVSEVAARISVNAATGATGDGRWILAPSGALILAGGVPTGIVTVTGVAGRNTQGLALALHATSGGRIFRCETRSGVPPGPTGGEAC